MSTQKLQILFWSDAEYPSKHVGGSKVYPSEGVDAVIEHLKTGTVHETLEGPNLCHLCGVDLGAVSMTDGRLVWPSKAHHYVTAHKVWTPQHQWLAESLLLGREDMPPEAEEPFVDDDRTKDEETSSSGDDWASFALKEDLDLDIDISVHPVPASSEEEVVEYKQEDPAEDVDPWAMNEDMLDQIATEAVSRRTSSRKPRPRSPVRRTVPRAPGSRRPGARHRRRARRLPGELSQVQSEEEQPLATQNRPQEERLDAMGPVSDSRQDASSTALALAHQETSMHPESFGAANEFATAIAQAYPRAGLPLAQKVVEVAAAVGAHPFDLANLIQFESAKTWSPSVQNPRSKATGLIQFYPGLTERNIGISVDKLIRMSAIQQMDWVRTYLDKMRNGQPLNTPHKVAMSVFYPMAISWGPQQRFPAAVTQANPGIYTPADYTMLMMKTARLPSSTNAPSFHSADSGGGIWEQVSSWFSNLLGGETAPAQPAAPPQPVQAVWSLDPSVNARLVSTGGQPFGPGPLPPGRYTVEAWVNGQWSQIAPVELTAGRTYRLYVQGGRVKWSEL